MTAPTPSPPATAARAAPPASSAGASSGATPAPPPPSYYRVLLDPIARNYVITIIAAVLVIFIVQLESASMIASLLTTTTAVVGLLLRKRTAPMMFVVLVAYFQIVPMGIPAGGANFPLEIRETHFRLNDVVLVMATLTYLVAHWRFFSLAAIALPEGPGGGPTTLADRRPPRHIADAELSELLVMLVGLVFAGQLAWIVASEIQLDFRGPRLIAPRPMSLFNERPPVVPNPALARLLLIGVLLGGAVALVRLRWYLGRLRTLSRDEASLVLRDAYWADHRRELARLEAWRASGLPRSLAPGPLPRRPRTAARSPERNPERSWGGRLLRWLLLLMLAVIMALVITCGLASRL